jgi:hypothetical protein
LVTTETEETEQRQGAGQSRAWLLVRRDHLWVLVVLCTFGVFISLSPTDPEDFWWHLKAGELLAHGNLVAANMFAWTLPVDAPFIYQSWLGEWLFYVLYEAGGLPLVIFARNMLGVGAFALVALEAYRRSGSWRLAAGALLLAASMSLNNLNARTQNWSWIPFMLLLLLLSSYVRLRLHPRWLVLLPLVMIFWVNVHGAFIMGILVMGAFVVGETLRNRLRQPYALNRDQLKPLYLAAVGMVVATIINPLGVGVFGYVYKLLSDPPSQTLGMEWQPPDIDSLAGAAFYLSVLVLIAAFAFARRRPTITDVLLVCGLLWMAFSGTRYVIWFGMVAMPIAAQVLGKPRTFSLSGGTSNRQQAPRRVGMPVLNTLIALLLVVPVIAVQPWFKPALSLPQPYQALFAPVPEAPLLFSADTPVEAAEHLRAEPCAGHLFNEMGQGSYLIWALYPEVQVFVDPRVELYPLALWQEYLDVSQGYQVGQFLERYEIACVLLDTGVQPRLSETLAELSGWQQTFTGAQSEVWRREDG